MKKFYNLEIIINIFVIVICLESLLLKGFSIFPTLIIALEVLSIILIIVELRTHNKKLKELANKQRYFYCEHHWVLDENQYDYVCSKCGRSLYRNSIRFKK